MPLGQTITNLKRKAKLLNKKLEKLQGVIPKGTILELQQFNNLLVTFANEVESDKVDRAKWWALILGSISLII